MSKLACQYNQPKRPGDLDLLTLKVVSESRVTWATSVPILVFLGLSVLELGPMYATDRRQTDVREKHRFMPPPISGGGIIRHRQTLGNGEDFCRQQCVLRPRPQAARPQRPQNFGDPYVCPNCLT